MVVIQLVYQQIENYVVYPVVYRTAISLPASRRSWPCCSSGRCSGSSARSSRSRSRPWSRWSCARHAPAAGADGLAAGGTPGPRLVQGTSPYDGGRRSREDAAMLRIALLAAVAVDRAPQPPPRPRSSPPSPATRSPSSATAPPTRSRCALTSPGTLQVDTVNATFNFNRATFTQDRDPLGRAATTPSRSRTR